MSRKEEKRWHSRKKTQSVSAQSANIPTYSWPTSLTESSVRRSSHIVDSFGLKSLMLTVQTGTSKSETRNELRQSAKPRHEAGVVSTDYEMDREKNAISRQTKRDKRNAERLTANKTERSRLPKSTKESFIYAGRDMSVLQAQYENMSRKHAKSGKDRHLQPLKEDHISSIRKKRKLEETVDVHTSTPLPSKSRRLLRTAVVSETSHRFLRSCSDDSFEDFFARVTSNINVYSTLEQRPALDLYDFTDMEGKKNLNKNAISAFEEYGVQHRLPPKVEIVSERGPPHRPEFVAVAKLGDEEVCTERGSSKHEARIKAAERALQKLSVQAVDSGQGQGPDQLAVESAEQDITNPVPYKDPVSALMEYGQFAKRAPYFDLISQEGPPHMPVFTMAVKLGEKTFPSVTAGSSKDAKKRAACVALNTLKSKGELQALFPDTKTAIVPATKPKAAPVLGVPGKNPLSVLFEFAQKMSMKLTFDCSASGPPHKPVFQVWAVLNDEVFPYVKASNKKEGKVLAAEMVLSTLANRGQYVLPKAVLGQTSATNNHVSASPLTHHDHVARTALRKFDELLLVTPESLVGRKVIAAIVMHDRQQDVYRVVSIGSGNRCVKGSHITDSGTVLHDSHAEVLACRGFKRFLYRLLTERDLPILEERESGKFTFKPEISFHLYISTAPCGDGALFTHSDKETKESCCPGAKHKPMFTNTKTQGLLRAKQENGEGTIPVETEFVAQTYDGIQQGGRLRVMSCSDKICQWNVLGLQGAMLSTIFEPVYLKSVTLGNLFNGGHLARALCCRIDHDATPLQPLLPAGYRVNHPDLGVTSHQDPTRVVEKARPLSINWSYGDKDPEITDGTIGQTIKTVDRTEGPSRLCKKSILSLYRKTIDDKSNLKMFYKQIKCESDDYNKAKMVLHRRFQEQGFGNWVCMPPEVDRFY